MNRTKTQKNSKRYFVRTEQLKKLKIYSFKIFSKRRLVKKLRMEFEYVNSCKYVSQAEVVGEAYENLRSIASLSEAHPQLGSIAALSEANPQLGYAAPYLEPTSQHHFWTHGVHPYHSAMPAHWTHYTDVTQHAMKAPAMSAHSYAIARRNERERNRVRHINSTFERLRKHLPSTGRKRKLSKVDTLRTAIRYIEHLQDILDETEPARGDVTDDDTSADKRTHDPKDKKVEHNNNNNNKEPKTASLTSAHEDDSLATCSENSAVVSCEIRADDFHDCSMLGSDLNSCALRDRETTSSPHVPQTWQNNFI